MTDVLDQPSVALLVRSQPYQRRSARAELDVALAALVMEYRVEVYFIGPAILQLVTGRNPEPALLASAYRAWGSLPDLGEFAVFAEPHWLERLEKSGGRLLMPVEAMATEQMRCNWRLCDHSMVL